MNDFEPVEIRIDFQQNVDTEGKKATEGIDDVAASSAKLRAQLEKDIAAQRKVIDALTSEIKQLQAQMAKPVTSGDDKAANEKAELAKQIDLLNKKLIEQEAIIDRLRAKQGAGGKGGTLPGLPADPAAYAKGMNQLGYSVQQVARELPSLAISPQMFILAISNNLPILQDQLAKTKLMNEALAASGQKTIPVWKQVAGSIFSWQTALVALITVGTVWGKDIANWIGSLFKFRNEVGLTRDELKALKSDLSKSLGKEIGQMDFLFNSLKNAKKGTEDYNDAKKQIIEQYGKYLAGMDTEITKLNNVEGAYRAVTEAIYEQARAKALQSTYEEQAGKLLEQTTKQYEVIRSQFIGEYGETMGGAFFAQFRKELESGNGLSYEMKRIVAEFDRTATQTVGGGNYGSGTEVTVVRNRVREAITAVTGAQAAYNGKVKEATDLLGDLVGKDREQVSSLIAKQELLLAQAKLMPETTEAEISTKNKRIESIQEEIKRLKDLGKAQGGSTDSVKSIADEINRLYASLADSNEADRVAIAKRILQLQQELLMREKIAEEAVKAVRNEQVPASITPKKQTIFTGNIEPVKKVQLEVDKLNKKIEQGKKKAAQMADEFESIRLQEKFESALSLTNEIAATVAKITDEYSEQLGLNEDQSRALNDGLQAISGIADIASGNYIQGAAKILDSVFSQILQKEESIGEQYKKMQENFENVLNSIDIAVESLSNMNVNASLTSLAMMRSQLDELAEDAKLLNSQFKDNGSYGRRSNLASIYSGAAAEAANLNDEIERLSEILIAGNVSQDQRDAINAMLESYNSIMSSIDSAIEGIIGTSVSDLRSSLADAFLEGEDAAAAWGDTVNDIIRNIAKNQLISSLLTEPVNDAIDSLLGTIGDGDLSTTDIEAFQEAMSALYESAAPAFEAAIAALEQAGISYTDTNSTRTGSTKGIAQASQDSVDELNGRMTAIQAFIYDIRSMNAQSLDLDREAAAYQQSMLGYLETIADNTSYCRKLEGVDNKLNDIILKGIKIKN